MSEPYNGMHDDEFFDWYIQVSNAIEEGVSEGGIIQHLRMKGAPEWVITRLQSYDLRKGT